VAIAVYASVPDFKDEHGITSTDQDLTLGQLLEDASRAIDRWCDVPPGHFGPQDETRVFDVTLDDARAGEVQLPALLSVTTFKTDEDGSGTFEVTWTASTDFILYPLNTTPKTVARVNHTLGRYAFPVGQQRLQIVGSWGQASAVPVDIARACMIQANRWRFRTKSPEGIAGNADVGFVKLADIDPDVAAILERGRYRMAEVFA